MTNNQLLQHFIETWPLERVRNMSLEEYNKQGSKDTFCYMLEYGTRSLGNISGTAYSSKFEIYERKDKKNIAKSKDYGYDSNYTWRNRDGVIKTRNEAFEYTRNIIVEVIDASKANNFRAIDGKKIAPFSITTNYRTT
jgi:5-methylcytosine-specific restriction protein B